MGYEAGWRGCSFTLGTAALGEELFRGEEEAAGCTGRRTRQGLKLVAYSGRKNGGACTRTRAA